MRDWVDVRPVLTLKLTWVRRRILCLHLSGNIGLERLNVSAVPPPGRMPKYAKYGNPSGATSASFSLRQIWAMVMS